MSDEAEHLLEDPIISSEDVDMDVLTSLVFNRQRSVNILKGSPNAFMVYLSTINSYLSRGAPPALLPGTSADQPSRVRLPCGNAGFGYPVMSIDKFNYAKH